jgi:hypothetical protein
MGKKKKKIVFGFCVYSIADLQALLSQFQALSSNASNPALFVTPGITSEWFLDSSYYNHMTDNPHLTIAHTPPVLPTITTADGSTVTLSLSSTYLFLMSFVFLNCILIFYLLAN